MSVKPSAREIFELIGVVAVVASLVFVGLQLMQDRQLALSNIYATTNATRGENARTKLESDSYMILQDSLWQNGVRPRWWSEELKLTEIGKLDSGSQIIAAYLEVRLSYLNIDDSYYQYQQGLISELYWSGARNTLKNRLRDEFERAVILDQAAPVNVVVRELIEELDRESET